MQDCDQTAPVGPGVWGFCLSPIRPRFSSREPLRDRSPAGVPYCFGYCPQEPRKPQESSQCHEKEESSGPLAAVLRLPPRAARGPLGMHRAFEVSWREKIPNLAYQTLGGSVLFAGVSYNLETSWTQAGNKQKTSMCLSPACVLADNSAKSDKGAKGTRAVAVGGRIGC